MRKRIVSEYSLVYKDTPFFFSCSFCTPIRTLERSQRVRYYRY